MLARCGTAVVLMVVLAACCPEPPPPAPVIDLAAEEQAIRALSAGWLEAAKARDGAAIDALMRSDATTIFDGQVLVGLPAIQANREKEWAEVPMGALEWTTTGVVVAASGDLAVERGSWTETEADDGEVETGEYVTVWSKVDGQWKVLIDAGTELENEDETGDVD